MRHRLKSQQLGRKSAPRAALLANLVCALALTRRIETTLPKARAARSLAEKMITLAKKGTLAARRRAISILRNRRAVSAIFKDLAPAFKDRAGGYCRITKTGTRRGDASAMAILEWVGIAHADLRKKAKTEEETKKQ
ncbi:MAG: 50S ribosomal protein L17 [Kiritimatiellia bacterium]